MVKRDYWKSLCVTTSEIDKNIQKNKLRFRLIFNKLSQSKQEELARFLQINFNENMSPKERVKALLESEKLKEYAYLDNFCKGRKDLLEQFFNKPKFNELFQPFDDDIYLMKLIRLYENDPENLVHALLFCEFIKKQGIERFMCEPCWTEEHSKQFIKNLQSLKVTITRKYKRKFVHVASFDDGECEYHTFHREKRKVTQESFGLDNVSYIQKSDLFIHIDKNKNLLDLRCRDSRLRNIVADFISSHLNLSLFYVAAQEPLGNINNTIKETLITPLESLEEDEIYIDRVAIKKVGDSPKVPCIIGGKNSGDIRNTLSILHDNNIVDLENIHNISSFNINIDGKSYCIIIKKEKDGTVILKYEGISEDFVVKKIKDKFEIPINISLTTELREGDYLSWFNFFLNYDGKLKLNTSEKAFLEKLIKDGMVGFNKISAWICEDNPQHIFNREHDNCPECGGSLKLLDNYIGSSYNTNGIFTFVKNKLKSIYGGDVVKERKRKYRKKPYVLLSVDSDSFSYNVYVDNGKKDIKPICLQFQRSLLPVLIVTISKKPKGLINEDIFPVVSICDLYLKNDDYIKEEVSRLKSNYHTRLDSAARESFDKMSGLVNGEEIEYNEYDLEDDSFNLMKYIFEVGEKWGKEKNRKTVPEAALGYSTYYKKIKRGFKSGSVSIIWDSKFCGGEGTYNFSTSEKDKARRYIQESNQSDAIKNFSGMLNAYITFCNSINLTQYNRFAQWLYNYRTWKGSVVLFELKALLKLYDFVRSNEDLFRSKKQVFLSEFSKLIERDQDNYIHITSEKIGELLNLIEETERDRSLETVKLREHLELNEIR